MRIEAGQESSREAALRDPLRAALVAQSSMWPEVLVGIGDLEPGWITAEALFASDTAIDEYLDYEGSFHAAIDRKTCAAAMMVDYCYIFSIATVPLLAGFGIIPDLSSSLFALQFYTVPLEHEGRILEVRRAHVFYLSPVFSAGWEGNTFPADTQPRSNWDLCEIYRHAAEAHLRPLVTQLHARTGLSRNALWRLGADAIAGRFLDAGRRFGRLEQAKAMTILKQPGSPLCNRQLHYFDLTLRDEEQRELLSWTQPSNAITTTTTTNSADISATSSRHTTSRGVSRRSEASHPMSSSARSGLQSQRDSP